MHDTKMPKTDKLLAKLVLMSKMANDQLPQCTFSMPEFLQWWTFIPAKRNTLQDFEPKWGGGGVFAKG